MVRPIGMVLFGLVAGSVITATAGQPATAQAATYACPRTIDAMALVQPLFQPARGRELSWADGDLPIGNGPVDWQLGGPLSWSPTGDRLLRASTSGGDFLARPQIAWWDDTEPVELVPPPTIAVLQARGSASRATWSPDGTLVALPWLENGPSTNKAYAVHALDGSVVATLPLDGTAPIGPVAFSPNGDLLVSASDVVRVHDMTGTPTEIAQYPVSVNATWSTWSDDGQWVVLGGSGSTSVWAIRTDGSASVELGTSEHGDLRPSFRPGSHQVLWAPDGAPGSSPFRITDLDGGPTIDPVLPDVATEDAAWSPDGSQLAVAGRTRVWLVPAGDDGSSATAVGPTLSDGGNDRGYRRLAWAPDGQHLAVTAVPWSTWQVGVIDTTATSWPGLQPTITIDPWSPDAVDAPSWSTDASEVLFDLPWAPPVYGQPDRPHTAILEDPMGTAVLSVAEREMRWYPCPNGTVPATTGHPTQPSATPAPTITSVQPRNGSTLGGTTVTITGTNLRAVVAVRFGNPVGGFGDPDALTFEVVDDQTIVAVAPPRSTTGLVNVTVLDANGASATGPAAWFTYHAPPTAAPTVTSIVPNSGDIAGGGTVTITGAGFLTTSEVRFGPATPATSYVVVNDTTITAVVPPATAPVLVNVWVTNHLGTNLNQPASWYRYHHITGPAPTVTAVTPRSGPPSGGTSVTVTGTGFTGATQVRFASVVAPSFTVVDDQTIVVLSPPHPAALVSIRVTSPNGTSTNQPASHYAYR